MPFIEYYYAVLYHFRISSKNSFVEDVIVRHYDQLRQIFYRRRIIIWAYFVGGTFLVLVVDWYLFTILVELLIDCKVCIFSFCVFIEIIAHFLLNLVLVLRCYIIHFFLIFWHRFYFIKNPLKLHCFNTLIIVSLVVIVLFLLYFLITA